MEPINGEELRSFLEKDKRPACLGYRDDKNIFVIYYNGKDFYPHVVVYNIMDNTHCYMYMSHCSSFRTITPDFTKMYFVDIATYTRIKNPESGFVDKVLTYSKEDIKIFFMDYIILQATSEVLGIPLYIDEGRVFKDTLPEEYPFVVKMMENLDKKLPQIKEKLSK